MAVDHIRYDLLTQEALRSVVKRVLADAAKNGLLGEHHFYVSFDTRHPGTRLSHRLLDQYPEEMTIVLQHQFWDLTVHEQAFEVGLSFNGISERLHVPFSAVKGFFDPSVQFGLQFQAVTDAASGKTGTASEPAKFGSEPQPANTDPDIKPVKIASDAAATSAGDAGDKGPGSGEVVRLDRYRKK